MGGSVKKMKQDATSVDAWVEHGTQIVELTPDLAVKIRVTDVLTWIESDEGTNPLLQKLQKSMKAAVDEASKADNPNPVYVGALIDNLETMPKMVAALNRFLIDVVVEPQLKEQEGNEDSPVSVANIKPEWKMRILFESLGGDELQGLLNFRGEASSPVVSGSKK